MNGQNKLKIKDFEINLDVVEKNYIYYYEAPDEKTGVFILDDAISIVNFDELKEIARIECKYDLDYPPLLEIDDGCAILTKNKIYVYLYGLQKYFEIPAPVSKFRTYTVAKTENKNILIASLMDQMWGIDLIKGEVIWTTKEKDENFEGFAHRYLKNSGNNVIMTYTSGGSRGTDIFVMSVNALDGSLNYKTPVLFNCKEYISDFSRGVSKFWSMISSNVKARGYAEIAFDYYNYERNNKIILAVLSTKRMRNPITLKDEGDGVVVLDPESGKVLMQEYARVSDYSLIQPHFPSEIKPYVKDNIFVLAGEEGIAAFDVDNYKKLWYVEDKVKGAPRDVLVDGGAVFVKYGEYKFSIKLDPPKNIFDYLGMKIEKKYDDDPYGFAAFDLQDGKLLWNLKTDIDPSFLAFDFSFANYFDAQNKRVYFADEKNFYALQLRKDGGKFDYVIDFSKEKLGKMKLKESYIIQEFPLAQSFLNYTAVSKKGFNQYLNAASEADSYCEYKGAFGTIWGAVANKRLGFAIDDNKIFIISTEAFAMYDKNTGKAIWKYEWDYDQKEFQFIPQILDGKFVYQLERKLTCVDLRDGKKLWEVKEAKRPIFLTTPNEKFLFVFDDGALRAYKI